MILLIRHKLLIGLAYIQILINIKDIWCYEDLIRCPPQASNLSYIFMCDNLMPNENIFYRPDGPYNSIQQNNKIGGQSTVL